MNKILLIGPFPNPTTGVSLANKIVFQGLNLVDDIILHSISSMRI